MGGLVKEVHGDIVKVHLHGRLGVITVPSELIDNEMGLEIGPGTEMQFYFSYFQITEHELQYDLTPLRNRGELFPSQAGGKLTEVNDTAVVAQVTGEKEITAAVPRRWVFTDYKLQEGLPVEFYFSRMKVTGKREIPQESI